MTPRNELLVSTTDAEILAAVVGDRSTTSRFEAAEADALADVLMDARMVPPESLPADRVAMNSTVAYREEPHGVRRMVAIVHPAEARPSMGRIFAARGRVGGAQRIGGIEDYFGAHGARRNRRPIAG